VFDAFERAKDLYVESGTLTPLHARVREITGGDPLPYGIEANRATIEELISHALRQKILRARPDVDTLFAPL
jgi:4,5-dihydroxyphthalate decarboxylase